MAVGTPVRGFAMRNEGRGGQIPRHKLTELRPFQRRFMAAATADGVDTAALSMPRGNGKSWLASRLAIRALTPGDALFVPGSESVAVAAALPQARVIYRFTKEALEPVGGYRFRDSANQIGIIHVETGTQLRLFGASGRGLMGLVRTPLVIADEPGAWTVNDGKLIFDAIQTAQGKPESRLRSVYIGTLAPSTGGWWHDLVAGGSRGSVHVTALQGNRQKWDQWAEIRRCNPLTAISGQFRAKLKEERAEAHRDARLKARFLSYRLNLPTADESSVLLTVDDWERACARPVPAREGRPIVGIDLGQSRAWSAAVALWRNGRIEACAVGPGVPDVREQERRDRVPAGTYGALVDAGLLRLADGLRVPPVGMLWQMLQDRFGRPAELIADRARFRELQDAVGGRVPLHSRVTRWFDAAADIRALRKGIMDGPYAPAEDGRPLLG